MTETWTGYDRAVNCLKGLSNVVKAGPVAVKQLANISGIPSERGDLQSLFFVGPNEMNHERLVHDNVEQYLSYFYRLKTCFFASKLDPISFSLASFSTTVPWLCEMVKACDENGSAQYPEALARLMCDLPSYSDYKIAIKNGGKLVLQKDSHPDVKAVIQKGWGPAGLNYAEMICTAILNFQTLEGFLKLKNNVGSRVLREDEKFVFECLLRAARNPRNRSNEHWNIVKHFMAQDVKLLTIAKECLREPYKPLPPEVAECLATSLELGETKAKYCLQPVKAGGSAWQFILDFTPRYIRNGLWHEGKRVPIQVHMAKVMTARAGFHLAQSWQAFNQYVGHRDNAKYRYNCRCQVCGEIFFSGRAGQKACGKAVSSKVKSKCQVALDNIRRRQALAN